MKPTILTLVPLAASILLASCTPSSESRQEGNRYGFPGGNVDQAAPYSQALTPSDPAQPPTTDPATAMVTPQPGTPPTTTPQPQTAAVGQTTPPQKPPTAASTEPRPYGTPVPGKPGFVTSPYAPYSGYVDVRGFPPNTEVKDPYTDRVFLVP